MKSGEEAAYVRRTQATAMPECESEFPDTSPSGRRKQLKLLIELFEGVFAGSRLYRNNEEARYASMRAHLQSDSSLWGALPPYIRRATTLADVLREAKRYGQTRDDQFDYIRNRLLSISAKIDHLQPALPLRSASVGEAKVALSYDSSGWTGRRSTLEQAKVVLSFAPAALEAISQLIEQHEARLHNTPPSSPDFGNLAALKELHVALGNLIALAERGDDLSAAAHKVRALHRRLVRWSKDQASLFVANSELCGAAALPALGLTFFVENYLPDYFDASMFGTAALGVVGAAEVARRSKAANQ